ncbi:DUF2252 family protein [Jatrophihabitans sp.]|uniref:DUF2252 family protein n=1 Tax=Jatrophihabitans sp. TaxID=1932789 RepID=UPI0030C6FDEB|nr:hypothetical protein [Jatrophihabitans sp.]
MSDIVSATADYEGWLGRAIPLVAEDLVVKHAELASSELRFLRGTYYFWLRQTAALLPAVLAAPPVPLVGDLHVENFGTWQDRHGVRRWGVNDLDELGRGPYTADLVRLATSCVLCPHIALAPADICRILLASWLEARPGHAVALDDAHHLRQLLPPPRSPERYYATLTAGAPAKVPAPIAAAVADSVDGPWHPSWHARRAGTGSLGHARYVGVDGHEAREAKQLGPASAEWAGVAGFTADPALYDQLQHALRGPWPASRIDGWQLRRLAPDVLRIEIDALARHDVERVLRSMAQAVADVHGVDAAALATARADASSRPPGWLADAVETMASDTRVAWRDWARPVRLGEDGGG